MEILDLFANYLKLFSEKIISNTNELVNNYHRKNKPKPSTNAKVLSKMMTKRDKKGEEDREVAHK